MGRSLTTVSNWKSRQRHRPWGKGKKKGKSDVNTPSKVSETRQPPQSMLTMKNDSTEIFFDCSFGRGKKKNAEEELLLTVEYLLNFDSEI